jgi:hypothetical protein
MVFWGTLSAAHVNESGLATMPLPRVTNPDGTPLPPRPGELYMLPPRASWHDDPKDRFHLVAVAPRANGALGSAFYGSTSGAQEVNGTPSITVAARRHGAYRNTLSNDTRIYPAIVRPVSANTLTQYAGRVHPSELEAVRRIIPEAYGFRQGNLYNSKACKGSLRGCVMQLNDATSDRVGTRFGVVISPHEYSAQRESFLTLLPLALDTEPSQDRGDLLLEEGILFDELVNMLPLGEATTTPSDSAILAAGEPFAIARDQIVGRRVLVMPDAVLDQAERQLSQHFGVDFLAAAVS